MKNLLTIFLFIFNVYSLHAQYLDHLIIPGDQGQDTIRASVWGSAVVSDGYIITGNAIGDFDLDPGGGVAMTSASPILEFYIAKYSHAGSLMWYYAPKRIGATSNDIHAEEMVVDDVGNIYLYVTIGKGKFDMDPGPLVALSPSQPFPRSAQVLIKYSASGNFLWAREVTSVTYGSGLAVSHVEDAVYLIGGTDIVPVISKFEASSGLYMNTVYSSNDNAHFDDIEIDDNGDLIISGSFKDDFNFGIGNSGSWIEDEPENTGFIAKYNNNYFYIWHYIDTNLSSISDIELMSNNVIVGKGPSTLSKVSSGGSLIQTVDFGFNTGDLAVDNSDNIYMSGPITGPTDMDPYSGERILYPKCWHPSYIGNYTDYLAKYTSSFGHLWSMSVEPLSRLAKNIDGYILGVGSAGRCNEVDRLIETGNCDNLSCEEIKKSSSHDYGGGGVCDEYSSTHIYVAKYGLGGPGNPDPPLNQLDDESYGGFQNAILVSAPGTYQGTIGYCCNTYDQTDYYEIPGNGEDISFTVNSDVSVVVEAHATQFGLETIFDIIACNGGTGTYTLINTIVGVKYYVVVYGMGFGCGYYDLILTTPYDPNAFCPNERQVNGPQSDIVQASVQVSTNGTTNIGQTTQFRAGQAIFLNEGFYTDGNYQFECIIASGCTNNTSLSCNQSGNVILSSQSSIDQFLGNHPSCDTIDGNLILQGTMTDLSGLHNIKHISGDLTIQNTSNLQSLNGLNSLISVDGNLRITSNGLLNLTGLNNLSIVNGELSIQNNNLLINTTGLQSVMNVLNDFLIANNSALTNISGLDHIIAIGGTFQIFNNSNLFMCSYEGVCNIISNSSAYFIFNNASGCESATSILGGC